jgi:hypothetical protein
VTATKAAALNPRLIRSLSAAQTVGNTLVLGMPGPDRSGLKNGKSSPTPVDLADG